MLKGKEIKNKKGKSTMSMKLDLQAKFERDIIAKTQEMLDGFEEFRDAYPDTFAHVFYDVLNDNKDKNAEAIAQIIVSVLLLIQKGVEEGARHDYPEVRILRRTV